MTNRELAHVGTAVASRVPGFDVHGSMLVLRPVTHTLRGLQLDSDGDERMRFHVSAFFQPLCVPANHVILNFGMRLKGTHSDVWDWQDRSTLERLVKTIEAEARPFLAPLESPRDVARAILARKTVANPHTWQAAAYLFAKEGNATAAHDALSHLVALLDPARVEWHAPMLERARWLADRVITKPAEVAARLTEWEQHTIQQLRLGELVGRDAVTAPPFAGTDH